MTNLTVNINRQQTLAMIQSMENNTVDINTLIEMFLNQYSSNQTKRAYRRSIYAYLAFLYGDVKELTFSELVTQTMDAQLYFNHYKEKLLDGEIKTSSLNNMIKGIKYFYNWLMGITTINGINFQNPFKINPFHNIQQVSENDSEGSEPLSKEELSLMLSKVYGSDDNCKLRNKLMFTIAITTGIRVTPLTSLTWNNIKEDSNGHYIEILDTNKNRKLMKIRIREEYFAELLEWSSKQGCSDSSKPIFGICPDRANVIIKEWAKSVGITKKITFHSLRTTTACEVYDKSENIDIARDMLGHSSIATTKRYIDKKKSVKEYGMDIITNTKDVSDLSNLLNLLSKESIIELLNNLDDNTKLEILKKL